jgi:small-conductance mechanosensitive channel
MDLSMLFPEPIDGWDITLAIISVIVGLVLSRWARKGTLRLLRRVPGVNQTVADVVSRIASSMVLLLAFGVALAFLGANIQPLIAIVLVVTVVLVLVLRGVADNFAAGVLIQARQTISLGDELQVAGPDGLVTGTVVELNSRSVLLLTVDGRTVHVPNSKLLNEPLVNDSSHGLRRSEVQVRIERGGAGVDTLMEAVTDAAASVDGVLAEPEPRAYATSVSPERLVLRLLFWHAPLSGLTATADAVLAVHAALEREGWTGTVTSTPGVPALVPSDPL